MPADDVAVKSAIGWQGSFQIYQRADRASGKIGSRPRLSEKIEFQDSTSGTARPLNHCQAASIDGDAVAEGHAFATSLGLNREANSFRRGVDAGDDSSFF